MHLLSRIVLLIRKQGFAAASPEAGVAVGDTAELSLLSPRGQATLDGTTLFGVRALEHGVTGGIPQVQSLLLTPSTNSEPPIMSGLNDGAEDIPNRPDDHPMLSTRRFMGPAIKDEPRSVLGRGTPAQTEEARRG